MNRQTIDLEAVLAKGIVEQFSELLENDLFLLGEGEPMEVFVVRVNCGACDELIRNRLAESVEPKNLLLVAVDSRVDSTRKKFPAWPGKIAAFKNEYEIMATTPIVFFVRSGKLF